MAASAGRVRKLPQLFVRSGEPHRHLPTGPLTPRSLSPHRPPALAERRSLFPCEQAHIAGVTPLTLAEPPPAYSLLLPPISGSGVRHAPGGTSNEAHDVRN